MNRAAAANAYADCYINTETNKVDILFKLYEGAIRFIRFAEMSMKEENISKKGESISRAVAIMTELDTALDRKNGEKTIVENLSNLYSYMIQRLTEANKDNDPLPLNEVRRLLEGLLDAWHKAAEQLETCAPHSMYEVKLQASNREYNRGMYA